MTTMPPAAGKLATEGVDATVKIETRETVAAVKALGKDEVSVTEIPAGYDEEAANGD